VLAKLMLLEERHVAEFEQLYQWQLSAAGAPAELAAAEAAARDGRPPKLEPDQRAAVESWSARPGVLAWLQLDPPLSGILLGPYFSLARDKLSMATPAARLAAHLQELVVAMQSGIDRDRAASVARARELPPDDRSALASALFGVAAREPEGPGMDAAAALAVASPDVTDAFFTMLGELALSRVPLTLPGALALRFKRDPRLSALLDRWASGPKRLVAAVDLVRGR
jgi:hypothetical protein